MVDALGSKADGVVGEMPSNIPGPKAPNAKAQAWLDKFNQLYKHQVPAGSWIMYTAVKAWANAVAQTGDPDDFKAVNKHLKENGYEGELGRIQFDQDKRAAGPGGGAHLPLPGPGRRAAGHLRRSAHDPLPGLAVQGARLDQEVGTPGAGVHAPALVRYPDWNRDRPCR